jgi:MFS family permease
VPAQKKEIHMNRKWWTLIAVCTGVFMLLLDITIVNVALPDMQQALNASLADLQWVIDAYALTLAALSCLVLALLRGNAEGWGSPLILALLGAAVALAVAFGDAASSPQPATPTRSTRASPRIQATRTGRV